MQPWLHPWASVSPSAKRRDQSLVPKQSFSSQKIVHCQFSRQNMKTGRSWWVERMNIGFPAFPLQWGIPPFELNKHVACGDQASIKHVLHVITLCYIIKPTTTWLTYVLNHPPSLATPTSLFQQHPDFAGWLEIQRTSLFPQPSYRTTAWFVPLDWIYFTCACLSPEGWEWKGMMLDIVRPWHKPQIQTSAFEWILNTRRPHWGQAVNSMVLLNLSIKNTFGLPAKCFNSKSICPC